MAYTPRKINVIWLLLFTLLMVVASLFVFVKLIESTVGGPIRLSSLWNTPTTTPRIAILKSDFTAQAHDLLRFNGSGKVWRDSTVAKWQQLLQPRGIEPYPLTDENIEDGILLNEKQEPIYDILILPSVRAMSDLQIERISEYLKKGGNILGTWALGIYRPNGEWRGWQFIENNFGVKFSGFVEQSTGSHQIQQQIFAGAMKRGLYLPENQVNTTLYKNQIKASDGALKGYVWVADKPLEAITTDYALVDTTSASNRRNAVQITFYNWVGGNPDAPQFKPSLNEAVRNFTLRGQTPLTADIPAGYRMRVGTYDRPIMVTPTHVNTQMAGFWYDHTIEDKPLPDAAYQSSGIVYGTQGVGRFVYVGHELIAMGAKDEKKLGLDPEDQQGLDHFFSNVLTWLHHHPIAFASSFPFGYDAAAMVGIAADRDFSTLTEYDRIMTQEKIRASYFVAPDLMAGNEEWLRSFKRQGEVGVIAENAAQALRGRESLSKILDGAPFNGGFWWQGNQSWLPQDLVSLQDKGFNYEISSQIGRSSVPQVLDAPLQNLVRIHKSGRSGEDAYLQGARDILGLQAIFLQDAERIRLEGGLYPILIADNELKSIEALEGVRNTVKQIRNKHFWIATAGELAKWTKGRTGVRTATHKTSAERTVVHISNDSDVYLDSVALYIYLEKPFNPNTENIAIRPETVQMKSIGSYLSGKQTMVITPNKDFQFVDAARMVLRLKVSNLSAHQDIAYQIDIHPKKQNTSQSWWRFW